MPSPRATLLGAALAVVLPAASANRAVLEDSGSARDEEEETMLDIIRGAFSKVKGPGSLATEQKLDETWKICGLVNWSADENLALDSAAIEAGKKELGISGLCDGTDEDSWDDTCKAVAAVVEATRSLVQKFPNGPRFANAFIVNWGQYPSWTSGTVDELDWDARPPAAKVHNASGIAGYSICNIIRTVLTQSPNQWGAGICSHMASLGVLSHRAPAKVLEMGVRLLWTGRHTPNMSAPCDYVYDRQPGLVPWKDESNSWVPPAAAAHFGEDSAACAGNEADCQVSSGNPTQPIGLPYTWAAAAINEMEAEFGGRCSEERRLNMLLYPGQEDKLHKQASGDQGGGPPSLLWACNRFIDPKKRSCRIVFNPEACAGLPSDLCTAMATKPIPKYIYDRINAWGGAAGEDGLEVTNLTVDDLKAGRLTGLRTGGPYKLPRSWGKAWSDAPSGDRERGEEYLTKAFGHPVAVLSAFQLIFAREFTGLAFAQFDPSFTRGMLQDACGAHAAMLAVDSGPLNFLADGDFNMDLSVPFFGQKDQDRFPEMLKPHGACNHAVFLSSCDEDANDYRIWTWGRTLKLSREWLLGTPVEGRSGPINTGMVCAAVLADQITWADSDIVA